MKHTILKALIFATVMLFSTVAGRGETPKGWFAAGSHPKDYEMSLDRAGAHAGNACAYLKSVVGETAGFGTLMQMFKADSIAVSAFGCGDSSSPKMRVIGRDYGCA